MSNNILRLLTSKAELITLFLTESSAGDISMRNEPTDLERFDNGALLELLKDDMNQVLGRMNNIIACLELRDSFLRIQDFNL
jgi:hypothetical protein